MEEAVSPDKCYRCIICGKSYQKEILLYAHITSHSQEITVSMVDRRSRKSKNLKRHMCKSCDFSCDNVRSMNLHKKEHSSSMNPNKENRSPVECSRPAKRSLSETADFKCDECGETFDTRQDFECHAKAHVSRPYQCDICLRKYKAKHGLRWHIKTNHESPRLEYKCEECESVYPLYSRLQQHVAAFHSDDLKVVCDVCGEKVAKLCLNDHKKTHSVGKDFKCTLCKSAFQTKEDLKTHTNEHFPDNRYECDACKKCFPSKKKVLLHLVKVHLNQTCYKKEESSDKVEEKVDDDRDAKKVKKKRSKVEKPFKCDEENCQYSTSQYSLLKAHKFKHNPFYKCVSCQEKFPSRSELKAHMFTHGERPYKCDQCNKCYKDKHGLGWHKKVQHDPSRLKFTCELCGKTYPFDSLLTQHINLTHAAEKQSVCDICGKNVSKTYLPMHRRTHGEKQYSCDVCQKSFLEKAYLKRHKMIHTGEKPYVCNVCGNLFRQHSTLTIHMRTHTGDRPYKCVLCDNAYKTHHNLKKHYRRSGHKMV